MIYVNPKYLILIVFKILYVKLLFWKPLHYLFGSYVFSIHENIVSFIVGSKAILVFEIFIISNMILQSERKVIKLHKCLGVKSGLY